MLIAHAGARDVVVPRPGVLHFYAPVLERAHAGRRGSRGRQRGDRKGRSQGGGAGGDEDDEMMVGTAGVGWGWCLPQWLYETFMPMF